MKVAKTNAERQKKWYEARGKYKKRPKKAPIEVSEPSLSDVVSMPVTPVPKKETPINELELTARLA